MFWRICGNVYLGTGSHVEIRFWETHFLISDQLLIWWLVISKISVDRVLVSLVQVVTIQALFGPLHDGAGGDTSL
jgi:hypothetical protein